MGVSGPKNAVFARGPADLSETVTGCNLADARRPKIEYGEATVRVHSNLLEGVR